MKVVKVYKAMSVSGVRKKKSSFVHCRKHGVTYRRFLPSYPKVEGSGLFAFDTIENAESWGGFSDRSRHILYECFALLLENPPNRMLSPRKALEIEDVELFWAGMTPPGGYLMLKPKGTLFCSVVIPIRRVR